MAQNLYPLAFNLSNGRAAQLGHSKKPSAAWLTIEPSSLSMVCS